MDFNTRRSLSWRSRLLAGSCGVRVVEDPKAQTFSMARDGTLRTPLLTEDDPSFERLINGGVVHEIAHFLFSDYMVLDKASPIERNFLMPFEDSFIELQAMKRWDGARADLLTMWEELYRLNRVSRPDSHCEDVLTCVGVWLLAHCRKEALGLSEAVEDEALARSLFEDKFGTDVSCAVQAILDKSVAIESTADSLELARRLLGMFVAPEAFAEQEPVLSGTPDQAGDAPGQAADDAQAAAGRGSQGSGSPDKQAVSAGPEVEEDAGSTVQTSVDQVGEHDPAQHGDTSRDSELVGAHDDDMPDDGKAEIPGSDALGSSSGIGRGAQAVDVTEFQPIKGDAGDLAASAVADIVERLGESASSAGASVDVLQSVGSSKGIQSAESLLLAVAETTIALRARLRFLLQSVSRERDKPGRTGRIDPKKLWKVRTGSSNVFKPETDALTLSTTIWMLGDVSGSMRGSKIELARRAMASVALALDGTTGVKTGIAVFPAAPHAVAIVKRPDERFVHASPRLAGVSASGGTPMAQALVSLAPTILRDAAERKILLMPTDGDADNADAARAEVSRLEAAGVEVVVLAVGKDVTKDVATHTIRISHMADLAGALFQHLQRRFSRLLSDAA